MNEFFNRSQNFPCSEVPTTTSLGGPDYIGFIDGILGTFPNLRLRNESALAQLAVGQYNISIVQGTSDRPTVPTWFCGYQDVDNGFLYLSPYQQDINRLRAINAPLETLETSAIVINDKYPPDRCLSMGIPGSVSYTFCILGNGILDTNLPLDGINWADAFYPVEAIQTVIDEITALVTAQVSTMVGNAAGGAVGGEEGGGGGIVGEDVAGGGGTGPGRIVSASWSGSSNIAFSYTGIGAPAYPLRNDGIRAMVCINGRKVDWLRDGQRVKTMSNIWSDPSYHQCVRAGQTVYFSLKNTSGGMETNRVPVRWGGPNTC